MIGRRGLLSGVGGALLLPQIPKIAQAADRDVSTLDPVETMVRLRSSTAGEYTIGWLDAVREIMIDGEITPFCRMLSVGFSRFRKSGDDYEAEVFEVAYYCDLETGRPHEEFTFPGEAAPVEVPDYRVGPATVRFGRSVDMWESYSAGGGVEPDEDFAPPGEVRLQRSVEDPFLDGDSVKVRANEYGRVYPTPESEPAVFYREWLIWKGDAQEVLATDNPNIPSELDYNAASSYRPYMKLDNRRGHTLENGFGRTANSMDEVPEALLTLLADRDPDVLEGPEMIMPA